MLPNLTLIYCDRIAKTDPVGAAKLRKLVLDDIKNNLKAK